MKKFDDRRLISDLSSILRSYGLTDGDISMSFQDIYDDGEMVHGEVRIKFATDLNLSRQKVDDKPDSHLGHVIVENQVLGKTFKYCKNCKVEVT